MKSKIAAQVLRETPNYIVTTALTRGRVRIIAKDHRACPSSGMAGSDAWKNLEAMSDAEFDGSVCLELGIGTWRAR